MSGWPRNYTTVPGGPWTLVATSVPISDTGWVSIGGAEIDPTKASGNSFIFEALLEATAGKIASLRLYNLTDGVAVAGVLTGTNVAPTYTSVALTAGSTTGFPNSKKTYVLQIKMDSGASPASVACKWAQVRQ